MAIEGHRMWIWGGILLVLGYLATGSFMVYDAWSAGLTGSEVWRGVPFLTLTLLFLIGLMVFSVTTRHLGGALQHNRHERKRLQAKLRERELGVSSQAEAVLLQHLPRDMSDAVLVHDESGVIVYANPQAHRLFDYEPGALEQRPLAQLIPPWRNDEVAESTDVERVVTDQRTQRLTRRGRLVMVSLSASPLKDPAGQGIARICVIRDISQQQAADDQARLIQSAIQHSDQPMAVVDAFSERNVLFWNQAMVNALPPGDAYETKGTLTQLLRDLDVSGRYEPLREAEQGRDILIGTDRVWLAQLTPLSQGRNAPSELLLSCVDITELHRQHQQVAASEQQLAQNWKHSSQPMCLSDHRGRLLQQNPAFGKLFQSPLPDSLAPALANGEWDRIHEQMQAHGAADCRASVQVGPDAYLEVQVQVIALEEHNHQPRWFWNWRDDSKGHQQRNAESWARSVLHSSSEGIATTNAQGFIDFINPAAESMLGCRAADVVGLSSEHLLKPLMAEHQSPIDRALRLGRSLAPLKVSVASDTDTPRTLRIVAGPSHNGNGQLVGGVLHIHDITDMERDASEMTHFARHDGLTGLLNRREFLLRVDETLETVRSGQSENVLAYLDLDKFKPVNDSVGHAAGDELLRQISTLIREQLRKSDLLGRLGGDEFGILFYRCDLDEADRLMAKALKGLHDFRFHWGEQSFQIGASVGLVAIAPDAGSGEELLAMADTACYAAKQAGRNRVQVYAGDMAQSVEQGSLWPQILQRAIEADQFTVDFDHASAGSTNALPGYARMQLRLHRGGELLPLDHLRAEAKRCGLAAELERWQIGYGFEQLRQQPDTGSWLALPVDAEMFSSNQFIDFARAQAERTGIDPGRVVFEFSEPDVMFRLSQLSEAMNRLVKCGFRCGLTQFTFSSGILACLRMLPLQVIELDPRLTRMQGEDQPSQNILVDAAVRLGHLQGYRVIAVVDDHTDLIQWVQDLQVDYLFTVNESGTGQETSPDESRSGHYG
ncbi:MAG: diguanylate cyclase [Halomonadaceae bacterium]|nr:MAG: diguanylate cyclase [Halomonadaceae bacterium]